MLQALRPIHQASSSSTYPQAGDYGRMENSYEDEQRRAFQLRQRGMSQSQQNGGENRSSSRSDAAATTTTTTTAAAAAAAGEQQLLGNHGNDSPAHSRDENHSELEDNEFESFHRSFTIGANLLDSMATRLGGFAAASAETNGGQEQLMPISCSPRPIGGPAGIGPQEPYPSDLSQLHEDPTVLQARKSMLARTGDRHARGKLPGPKEGRFIPPAAPPVDPQIPNTRSSKRYFKERRRLPDVQDGVPRVEAGSLLDEQDHSVTCRCCQTELRVKKAAFAVRCKSCGEVNPASSGTQFHKSRYSTQ